MYDGNGCAFKINKNELRKAHNDQEENAIAKARIALSEDIDPRHGRFLVTDETILRYLRGCDGHVDLAVNMLQKSLRWRYKRDERDGCPVCAAQPGMHPWRQIGFDLIRRPVIYYCFAQAHRLAGQTYTPGTVNKHLVDTMDNAIRSIPPDSVSFCVVWLVDFSGLRIADIRCMWSLLRPAVDLFSNHFPNTLSHFMGINPPRFFHYAWKGISNFLAPETRQKAIFLSGKDDIGDTISQHFDPETAEWIIEEIKLNAHRPIPTSQTEFWLPCELHDPRGAPSYLRSLRNGDLGDKYTPHPNILSHECSQEVYQVCGMTASIKRTFVNFNDC